MSQPLILVVDDDAELSGMLCELLAREGWATHAVLTIGDGERALPAMKPDAVLLDVMLPDGNGFDVCRRWRTAFPGLGIVMLTARGEPLDRVLGLEIGADDYLPKPFEPRELAARLQTVLRGGAAEQAGLAPGDEWVGLEAGGHAWRIARLDDVLLYAGSHRKVTALVARDLARLAVRSVS